jgi:hypothetical protein
MDDAGAMGTVFDKNTVMRSRGKLCRANPMSADGMK